MDHQDQGPELDPQEQLNQLIENLSMSAFGKSAEDVLGDAQSKLHNVKARDKKMADLIDRTFRTQHGQKTLEWMVKLSLGAPQPTIEELKAIPAEDRQLMIGYRAGMADIIRLIIDAMAQANLTDGET